MIHLHTIQAFRDEMEKIAVVKQIGDLLRVGFRGAPVGQPASRLNQALTFAGPALAAPSVISKEDPSGLGRSRAERAAGLAGSTLGSLALGGALTKATAGLSPGLGFAANLAGNLAAAGPVLRASEDIATSPFRAARTVKDTRDAIARRKAEAALRKAQQPVQG